MDEIRPRITSHCMNSCVMVITETWLDSAVPNAAIELVGRTVYPADRTADSAFCTDTVLTTKTIKVFPNQKPWLDRKVRSLLKARNVAYRSGDRLAYSNAQRELKKGITEAKQRYQQRIEGQFVNNNPRSMWRGIKAITDYKSSTPLTSHDATLPDA
ncbi:hypothetical protein QTP70_011677 [Hemibagrus guttatus]|uniref:Reverse transcriptase n=1 Tax=Hemibagrus guttatus TaxID=175788 RepID=A0AAE0R5U7_9TELE|nr:hypothetical protein QTP70_011677 [Hemibagrus guttatus]